MLRNYRVLAASAVVLVLVVIAAVLYHRIAGPRGGPNTPPINAVAAPSDQAAVETATAAADEVASATPPPPPPPPSDEALAGAAPAAEAALPTEIGECVTAHVKAVSTRLEDTPGSGSEITFDNGARQVSYEQVPAVDAAQPGDVVRMCLVSVPQGCPPGDDRGKQYVTADLRTHGTWSLPDSEHACGGA